MPLTTLLAAKDLPVTYKPLLLADIVRSDGSVLRLSTHKLVTHAGVDVPYKGNLYEPRLLEQIIDQIQALSDQGVDLVPSVTLQIANADGWVWTYWRRMKGAEVTLTLVMWDVGTTTFSTDEYGRFVGICDPPSQVDDQVFVLRAQNLLNMNRVTLPRERLQKRCIHVMPRTAADRYAAAYDPDSPFWSCGYSPDAGGPEARGNLNGGVPFTDCPYTKEGCVARGMYHQDEMGRYTDAFSGTQWAPLPSVHSRGYADGKWVDIRNSANEAKYGDVYPLVYGIAWVEPKHLNTNADANYTKFEAALCFGYIGTDYQPRVIVNDLDVPKAYPGNIHAGWNWVTDGNRRGKPSPEPFYDSKGDPYGSIAVIVVTMPKPLLDAGSSPRVRVLMRGLRVRVWSDTVTYADTWTQNPAWILLDLCRRANWPYSKIDIASFIREAAWCDGQVSRVDLNGNTITGPRYSSSLVVSQPRKAGELVQAFRRSFNAILLPSGPSGKLELLIEKSLADQQPNPVPGSNYNTAVSSLKADGTTGNGYVGYRFTSADIALDGSGKSTLVIRQAAISDTPNRVSIGTFQDAENGYATDSLAQVDAEDVSLVGQEVTATLSVEGINTYYQGRRVIAVHNAKMTRGNPEGDPAGGTIMVDLETSIKAAHLYGGMLVILHDPKRGFLEQLFRVTAIRPAQNYSRVRLTLQWHEDAWYRDNYGQEAPVKYSRPKRDQLARPPYGWMPHRAQPQNFDPLYDPTAWTFGLAQFYDAAADGSKIAKLRITGELPVNLWSDTVQPPFVPLQGTLATSGGAIAGGFTYWVGISAKDATGRYSPLSNLVQIVVPAISYTNTITVPTLSWAPGTAGYAVFAGKDPNRLSWQAESAGTPASITLTALNVAASGAPDGEFDHLLIRAREVVVSGLLVATVVSVTSNSIRLQNTTMSGNQFAGYNLSLLAKAGTGEVPILNFTIQSNTQDTLLVDSGNPQALGIVGGDKVKIWARPTVTDDGTNHILTDAALSLTADAHVGHLVRILAGPGAGQERQIRTNTTTAVTLEGKFTVAPTSASRFVIVRPTVEAFIDTSSQDVAAPVTVDADLAVDNLRNRILLVEAVAVDGGGALAWDNPAREVSLYGAESDLTPVGNVTINDVTNMAALPPYPFDDGGGVIRLKQPITCKAPLDLGTGSGLFAGCEVELVTADGSFPQGWPERYTGGPGGDYNFEITLDYPAVDTPARVYLRARSDQFSNALVTPAQDPVNFTPYVDITIPAAASVGVPDPLIFEVGDGSSGSWVHQMFWSGDNREYLSADWMAMMLSDAELVNCSGVQLWIEKPDGNWVEASGIVPKEAMQTIDGRRVAGERFSIHFSSTPSSPEVGGFVCVPFAADGSMKRAANGKPTGKRIDLTTLIPAQRIPVVNNLRLDPALSPNPQYFVDGQTGEQLSRVRLLYDAPAWPDFSSVPTWVQAPAGTGAVQAQGTHPSNLAYLEFVNPRPTLTETRRYIAGGGSEAVETEYSASLAYIDVAIAGLEFAPQVTNFAVTIQPVQGTNPAVPASRLKFDFTKPVSPLYWYARVERLWCDALWNPKPGATWELVWAETDPGYGAEWNDPPETLYAKFRSRSANWAEDFNDSAPPTVNVIIPASTGLRINRVNTATLSDPLRVVGSQLAVSLNSNEFQVNASGALEFKGVPLGKASGFNSAEYEIVNGTFQTKTVNAEKIQAGEYVRIGGVKGAGGTAEEMAPKPGQLIVFDEGGNAVGWIGKKQIGGVWYGGGWLKRLAVGGTSIADAKLVADANGNLTINGATITVNPAAASGYLSVVEMSPDGFRAEFTGPVLYPSISRLKMYQGELEGYYFKPLAGGATATVEYQAFYQATGFILRRLRYGGAPTLGPEIQCGLSNGASSDGGTAFLSFYDGSNKLVHQIIVTPNQGNWADFNSLKINGKEVIDSSWNLKNVTGGASAGVSSIESMTGAIDVVAGTNVQVSAAGTTLTISASHSHSEYAAAGHNHDGAYASAGHNHTGVYQPAGQLVPHDHDTAYVRRNNGIGYSGNMSILAADGWRHIIAWNADGQIAGMSSEYEG